MLVLHEFSYFLVKSVLLNYLLFFVCLGKFADSLCFLNFFLNDFNNVNFFLLQNFAKNFAIFQCLILGICPFLSKKVTYKIIELLRVACAILVNKFSHLNISIFSESFGLKVAFAEVLDLFCRIDL